MAEIDTVTLSNLCMHRFDGEDAAKMITNMFVQHFYRDHKMGIRDIAKALNLKQSEVSKILKVANLK